MRASNLQHSYNSISCIIRVIKLREVKQKPAFYIFGLQNFFLAGVGNEEKWWEEWKKIRRDKSDSKKMRRKKQRMENRKEWDDKTWRGSSRTGE
jgi:hypothetical protein